MYKYFAFISYSHADIKYARKLQERLEFYGLNDVLDEIKKKNVPADKTIVKMLEIKSNNKSVYLGNKMTNDIFSEILDFIKDKFRTRILSKKIKMYPMCRDENEFVPGEKLKDKIFAHMDASKKLILLCTEDYVEKLLRTNDSDEKSWVLQELEHFLEENKGNFKNIVFVNVYNDEKVINKVKEILKENFNEPEPYMVNGQSKQCYLEIIGSLLGVNLSYIKQRERIRKRKKRTKLAMISAVFAIVLAWFFAGNLIDRNIDNAIKMKNNDLSKSISLLLDSKKIANITGHSDARVVAELENLCDYDYGQPLRTLRFDNEYYRANNFEEINEDENLFSFHINKKNEDVVFDFNTGREFARYDYNEGKLTFYGYNNRNKTIKVESAAQGAILKINNNEIVIGTNNVVGNEKLHFINIQENSVNSVEIPVEWYNWQIGENGIYYLNDGNLFFHSKNNEDKFIKENVRLFHIKGDGTIVTDVQGEFCGVKNCSSIISSPNNGNLYLLTDEGISCVDENTMELKYSLTCSGNVIKFSSNGVAIIGSGNISVHDCEYLCFDESEGKIIKRIKVWASPLFDISNNGKYIAYATNDKIVVEELATGKSFDVITDKASVACGFRKDSGVFWSMTTRGEFYTWAISTEMKVPEMFNEIIFDSKNNDVSWVSDGNVTYRYDFKANELTPIFERGVSFISQSDTEIEFQIQIPESKRPLNYYIDKQTGIIVEKRDYKKVDDKYLEKDERADEAIKQLGSLLEKNGLRVDSLYSQISKDGNYYAEYIETYDPKNVQVSKKQMFRIFDIDKKKIVFEFEFADELGCPFEEMEKKNTPVFDAYNEKFVVCYEDANDLKLKTKVYTISGDEIATYLGYPVYLKGQDKYWNDTLILCNGKTVDSVSVYSDKTKVVDKAKGILNYIEMPENDEVNISISSVDNETFRYNSQYDFSNSVDVTIVSSINLIFNGDIVSDDKIIEFEVDDTFVVDVYDSNGVYEVCNWIDDNKEEMGTMVNRNSVPIIMPMSSRDGKEHMLHIRVVSNVGNIAERHFKIRYIE